MNPVTLVLLSALSDFFITGTGTVLGGNIQSGAIPSKGVWILAGVLAVGAFWKEVKQRLPNAQNMPRTPNGQTQGPGLPPAKLLVLIAIAAALSLSGCALTGDVKYDAAAQQAAIQAQLEQQQAAIQAQLEKQHQQVLDFLTALGKFTIADLQAASADAKAHNDPEFAMCWDGLIPIVAGLQVQGGGVPPGLTLPKGAASFVQAIRDILQGGGAVGAPLILKQVNMACGAAYVSARHDIIKVVVAVTAAASGAPGAGSLLGGIPSAIGPLLQGLPIQP